MTMTTPTPNQYKYNNPYEWLEKTSSTWTKEQLRQELLKFAQQAGFDAIQDEYQTEMDADGYFEPY
jgi:hypothetical protein